MVIPFLSKANHWQPDPYQFESNMTVIAILHFDDVEQRSASIEIGAHFKTTELIDETYANDLFFYPNPASDFINICGLEKETDMTIYDLMGKVVLKTLLESGDNMIGVSKISNGTYIIAADGKFNIIVINR